MAEPIPFPTTPGAPEGTTLPQNVEAEAALLGAMMIDNRIAEDVLQRLRPEHFFEPLHGRIYESIAFLVGENRLASPVDHQAKAAEGEAAKVAPTVRRFLIDHRAGWQNLSGAGADAAAKAYGVEQIPAGFLIAKDGTIVDVDLKGEALDQAVARAVGKPASN